MRVQFVKRENGPDRLVCEAELVFDEDGPLAGTKLVGFSVWRDPAGECYVTVPSRAFGAGSQRVYFDYVRGAGAADGAAPVKRLKAWIIEQLKVQEPGTVEER